MPARVYSNLVVGGTTFSNNTATLSGGAIDRNYNSQPYVSCEVYDSHFDHNSADSGGGVASDLPLFVLNSTFQNHNTPEDCGPENECNGTYGGAIYQTFSPLEVAGSDFFLNSAGNGGAIASYLANTRIETSQFESNSADDRGGAIDASQVASFPVEVSASTFHNNSAGGSGGAIAVGVSAELWTTATTLVEYSSFSNNSAGHSGGALWTAFGGENTAMGLLWVHSSSFIASQAGLASTSHRGGAIYSERPLRLTNTGLTGGLARGSGGLVYVDAGQRVKSVYVNGSEISNSEFQDGVSLSGHGGALYLAGKPNSEHIVAGSTFRNSYAGYRGGGLYLGWRSFVWNSTFSGNFAAGTSLSTGGGGGMYLGGTSAGAPHQVAFNTVADNETACNACGGGGVYVATGSTLKANLIADNHALNMPNLRTSTGLVSGGYNLISTGHSDAPGYCTATDVCGTSAAPVDPLLGPLTGNGGPTATHMPAASSPALDRMPSTASCRLPWQSTGHNPWDQRGMPRPSATVPACDIGSVERE